MEPRALERIAGLIQDLPALPAVAQEALALLSDPQTEAEDLNATLSRDPALSLKVLRLANSAFYRRKREIATLTSAILLLGFKTIQTLILSSAVHRVLALSGKVASSLWDHCFAVGVACRELSRRTGASGEEAEEAFLAGLFHDTAKGVIASKFPGVYGQPLGVRGEEEVLGFHHGHLGQVLLARWEIPDALVLAVATHHEDRPGHLGSLVALADWLSWEVAPGMGAPVPECPEAVLQALGIPLGDVDGLRERLGSSLAEERAGHG